jgi:hypothetical protein
MSFYIGTKSECEAYDAQVSEAENYQSPTQNWFTPIELPDNSYAVMKHASYPSSLQEVESISELMNGNV